MDKNKFKKGDRVVAIKETEYIKLGATGTVIEDDNVPFVKWDSPEMLTEEGQCADKTWPISESKIELITDEQPEANHIGDVNKMIAGKTEEEWLWEFAGRAMQGILANPEFIDMVSKEVAESSIGQAKILIAELKKGGGQ